MRFPFKFTRWHGTPGQGGKAIGSDTSPVGQGRAYANGAEGGSVDNVFEFSTTDELGRALSSLTLAVQSSVAGTLNVAVYIWDENSADWLSLGSAVAVVAGVVSVAAYKIPAPPAHAVKGQSTAKIGQSLLAAFIVTSNGTPADGAYNVLACPTP